MRDNPIRTRKRTGEHFRLDVLIAPAAEAREILPALCAERPGFCGCEERAEGDQTLLRCWFDNRREASAVARWSRSAPGIEHVELEHVPPRDWQARWRASLEPVRLCDSIWVSPSWLKPPMAGNESWLRIEPGMSFGTGYHETTRLSARALAAVVSRADGARVLDIGSGTGILCLVGRACTAVSCTGVEVDPGARGEMVRNLHANPAPGGIHFVIGTVEALKPAKCWDIVVMNMLMDRSTPLLSDIRGFLRPGGVLIWSGILCIEHRRACEEARRCGFTLEEEAEEGEWWCGIFASPNGREPAVGAGDSAGSATHGGGFAREAARP